MFILKSLLFLFLLWKSSESSYIAEGYFVIDYKTVERYINERTEIDPAVKKQQALQEIVKDIDYFLTEINKLFLTMGPNGLGIEIRVKKMDILSSNIFNPSIIYLGNQVDENLALAAFDNWIVTTRADVTVGFDFALLWTGFDLRGSLIGDAHVGTVCTTQGTSVIEFDGTYRVVQITAQMIASNLGASYDGSASTYVMSRTMDPSNRNRWTFSTCTATDLIDYINTLTKPTCLDTTSSGSVKPLVTPDLYTGQLLNPDVVCKRDTNSSTSYMCKNSIYGQQPPKGDNVCSYIYCYIPGTDDICGRTYATDGFICDVGKRCLNGACQSADSALTRIVDPSCLWGDQEHITFTNPVYTGVCSGFIQQYGLLSCYDSGFYQPCCSTCKRMSTGISGCEYGDTSTDCTKYSQANVCTSDANRKICCNYCKDYLGKRSTDDYIPVVIKQNIPVITPKKSKLLNQTSTTSGSGPTTGIRR